MKYSQILIYILTVILSISISYAKDKYLGNRTTVMWEYEEWNVNNSSWSDNPFDVRTTVTFKHQDSNETRTTEMFYEGNDTWKFRFTGIKTGKWTFTTSSTDSELDGYKGTVTVKPNSNEKIHGFLTNRGNKFAIQKDENKIEAYLFNVYMNGLEQPRYIENFGSNLREVRKKTVSYVKEAVANGFEIIFVHVNNNWFKFGTRAYTEHNSEKPDHRTFEVLETIITTAHKMGARIHIWAWGDEARKWTPIGVGGQNGIPDKRLQRYIAARLAPLPGWTMGYGFDLQEWASESEVREWAAFMHDNMSWQHLLCARGRSNPELDIVSYSNLGPDGSWSKPYYYNDAVTLLNSDTNRPHFFEERFTRNREGIFDMDTTLRLLWQYTMAGGIGSFWGFYDRGGEEGPPYPNPEQLRTHYTFWHKNKRFLLDMRRANELTNGYALKNASNTNYVFYKKNTSSIQINLSEIDSPQPAVAVDTKKKYTEIDLGILSPTKHTLSLAMSSDWAIAVGKFNNND